jgi:hypothetical protein
MYDVGMPLEEGKMARQGKGQDIVAVARTRLGEKYVLGAKVPKDNPNWKGPWDCAEFVSWCAFQAYGIAFGMRPQRADRGDAYSGYWYDDAREPGIAIRWRDALDIPGAILVRKPRPQLIGHVSICVGDGKHTIEARGARFGVNEFGGAADRDWDVGVRLPGVDYDVDAADVDLERDPDFIPPPRRLPPNYLGAQVPHQKSPAVLAVQDALRRKGIDPGPLDGDFGRLTEAAVGSFQASEGLELDGIVGPNTARALGFDFPIVPGAAIMEAWAVLQRPDAPLRLQPQGGPAAAVSATIRRIIKDGSKYSVEFSDGTTRFVGTEVPYSDDMHRRGLYQDRNLSLVKDVGLYAPADYLGVHGKWAHFIRPTIMGESSGYFGRLNSYDRAAFTFGATQLAAHTPDENLILLFRKLLALPSAPDWFPELSLAAGKVTLTLAGGGTRDLEKAELFTRPNGVRETQLRNFMNWLNPDPVKIDSAEVSAGARLMAWTKAEPAARNAQIELLVERSKKLVAEAKSKLSRFDGRDWRIAIWVVDIRYQSRGSYSALAAALSRPDPLGALYQIGGSYADRRNTVRKEIAALEASGVLAGFTV